MNRSRRLLAAAFTVVAVLGAVAFASAASLSVAPGVMTSTTAANPCTATATATNPSVSGSTTTVSLTVPAACVTVPRTVQVTVVDSGGVHSSASETLSSAALPITLLTAYMPADVLSISVTLDGWNLTTTWSYTPPPPKASCRITRGPVGATCDVEVTRRIGIFEYVFYDVVVISSSPKWTTWEVTLNLTHTFYAPRPTSLGNSWITGDDGNVERATCGSGALVVRGTGTSTGDSFRNVTDGTDREFTLVVDPPLTPNLLQGCS